MAQNPALTVGSSVRNTLSGIFGGVATAGQVAKAVYVVCQLVVITFPLPAVLLDTAIAVSLTAGLLILLTSLSIDRPKDFTILPTTILVTTLLRLSLNVAISRRILSHGDEGQSAAGAVVGSVGNLLMGGDPWVGAMVFLILALVNFVVITKGAGRVAEVSARFYLDSLPGRQMAIDTELSAGVIDTAAAKLRRAELYSEAAFYGSMDGASKFIRGDAICGLIVIAIDVIGGIGVSIFEADATLSEATRLYATLAVGDGLVSQIPALMVSAAAGIVVTKTPGDAKPGDRRDMKLGIPVDVWAIAAVTTTVVAFLPGIPTIPFLGVGLVLGAITRSATRPPAPMVDATPPPAPTSGDPSPFIRREDTIRIELGYDLLALASQGVNPLPEQVRKLRRGLASEFGFVLPPVRIQDNVDLDSESYRFFLKDTYAGEAKLKPSMLMAINSNNDGSVLAGESTTDPAFGLPAFWISKTAAANARAINWTVVEPTIVLMTHLAEVIKSEMWELLSYAETQRIIAGLPDEQRRILDDMGAAAATAGVLQRVLQALLAERVSIRDIGTILEGIQDAFANNAKSTRAIVAVVRMRLSRQISGAVTGPFGYIAAIRLSSAWEDTLQGSLAGPLEDQQIGMAGDRLEEFLRRLGNTVGTATAKGEAPVLITSLQLRAPMVSLLRRCRQSVSVVCDAEIWRHVPLKVIGWI